MDNVWKKKQINNFFFFLIFSFSDRLISESMDMDEDLDEPRIIVRPVLYNFFAFKFLKVCHRLFCQVV